MNMEFLQRSIKDNSRLLWYRGQGQGIYNQTDVSSIPIHLLTSCMVLRKLLNISEPYQFPPL